MIQEKTRTPKKRAMKIPTVYNLENLQRLNPSIDQVLHEAEIMGYDTSHPEFMGKFFKKIFKKIKKRIRKARKRKRGGKSKRYSVSTPTGQLSYAPGEGVQFMSPQGQAQFSQTGTYPGMVPGGGLPMQQSGFNIPGMGNIPPAALIGVPLLLYALMQKKKSGNGKK